MVAISSTIVCKYLGIKEMQGEPLKAEDFAKGLPILIIKQQEEDCEKILPPTNAPLLLWPDKMIHGLMGGLFFLTVIILLNMIVIMDEQYHHQFIRATFAKDLILSILCGIGGVLIPGSQRWDYFFYGFGLPLLLVF